MTGESLGGDRREGAFRWPLGRGHGDSSRWRLWPGDDCACRRHQRTAVARSTPVSSLWIT